MSRADEARLIYSLLNAAEEEQRLADSVALEKWLALKLAFNRTRAERAHAALIALFEDLERKNHFTGTWIEFRWLQAKSQRGPRRAPRIPRARVTHM